MPFALCCCRSVYAPSACAVGAAIAEYLLKPYCECNTGDADGDFWSDCDDECPDDADKRFPGVCGCGVANCCGDGTVEGTEECDDGNDLNNDACSNGE